MSQILVFAVWAALYALFVRALTRPRRFFTHKLTFVVAHGLLLALYFVLKAWGGLA